MTASLDDWQKVPPIRCAPWCENGDGHPNATSRRDQTCWGPMPYVDLTIEEEGHFKKEVYLPRVGVGAYRQWVMAKPLVYLHLDNFVTHHHGRPEILDESMHLTAAEARQLAQLLLVAASQVEVGE